MTNKIYFIANWKMYGHRTSANSIKNVIKLAKSKKYKNLKLIYCPPYTLIDKFVQKTQNSNISIGAQDCSDKKGYGAFTGNVSAYQLKNIGSKYVILGHSERRLDGDTNRKINQKIKNALNQNLKIILCIGETLKEKNKKKTISVLKKQLKDTLIKINSIKNIIIAYEPVWSIGTGVIPENKILQKNIDLIYDYLRHKFKSKKIDIIYGGSVNSNNIKDLNKINNLKGFLIGSASQSQNKFIDIVRKTIN